MSNSSPSGQQGKGRHSRKRGLNDVQLIGSGLRRAEKKMGLNWI